MKSKITLSALLLLLILTSCKKSSSSGGDYIQFELDGQLVRVESCPEIKSGGMILEKASQPYYSLASSLEQCYRTGDGSAGLLIASGTPIATQLYIDSSFYNDNSSFDYYPPGANGHYNLYPSTTSARSISHIEITSFDKRVGGQVTGKFSISNVRYNAENGQETGGHTVTNGEFRITLYEIRIE